MYTRKKTLLCMIVVTLLTSSFALKVCAQTFEVRVNPSAMSIALGEEVIVNVTVANSPSPGLYSYQFRLTYNATLLNATKAGIPSDHMLTPETPGNIFIVKAGVINATLGEVLFALTLLGTEPGKTGNGTLVSVTFKGLANGNSTLGLAGLKLVDATGTTIPERSYTVKPGSVVIIPEFSTAVLIAVFAIMSAAAVVLKKKLQLK